MYYITLQCFEGKKLRWLVQAESEIVALQKIDYDLKEGDKLTIVKIVFCGDIFVLK